MRARARWVPISMGIMIVIMIVIMIMVMIVIMVMVILQAGSLMPCPFPASPFCFSLGGREFTQKTLAVRFTRYIYTL